MAEVLGVGLLAWVVFQLGRWRGESVGYRRGWRDRGLEFEWVARVVETAQRIDR